MNALVDIFYFAKVHDVTKYKVTINKIIWLYIFNTYKRLKQKVVNFYCDNQNVFTSCCKSSDWQYLLSICETLTKTIIY